MIDMSFRYKLIFPSVIRSDSDIREMIDFGFELL